MKVSWAKAGIWIFVAAIIIVFVAIRPATQIQYAYEIETVSNLCSFDEIPEQDIRAVGNSIVITLPIQTPTPCYEVEGTVTPAGKNSIVVNLETRQVGEVCVQCVGVVTAKVTISDLEKGIYGLQVNSPDKALITKIMIG